MLRSRFRLGFITSIFVIIAVELLGAGSVMAANSSISQGFKSADSNITVASLVGIKKGDPNAVELISSNSNDSLVGIVGDNPLIELSGGGANTIQVVTSGFTSALVSDINGAVVAGDKITTSPIEGVGMKATQSGVVVGTAQEDLSSISTQSRTIKDKSGADQTVRIGLLPLEVGVGYFTVSSSTSSFVPDALQQLANSIVGRAVSPIRVLIAGLILLLLFISVTSILYSAIRSSIISIGRNPLSENAVLKGLAGVGLSVGALLAFTVLIVYVILVT